MKQREMVRFLLAILDAFNRICPEVRDLEYPREGCDCEPCQAIRKARAYVEGKK